MAAGEAVEAEAAAWVAAMALTPEENVNLIDTVAVTDRKYFFSFCIAHKLNIVVLDQVFYRPLCMLQFSVYVMILPKANVVSVV